MAALVWNAHALLFFPGTTIAILVVTNWRATLKPITPMEPRKNRARVAIQTVAGFIAIELLAYFTMR
jgi:hypothetical protein